MTVETLISYIGQDNIVDDVLALEDGENTLMKLGRQVCETAKRDVDSMAEWSSMVEEGQKIAKQETEAKNDPWQGASNYKDPAILEAAITFGDRASTELLRGQDLFKTNVIGNDPEGLKRQAAERVSDFMNWQINHKMREWRPTQRKLLYQLPAVGTVFKRTYHDTLDGKPKSELVHYPNFAVNQAATCLEESPFSIYLDVDVNGVFERQASGLWADVQIYPEKAEGDEGSNAEEEVDFSYDNPEKFIQQDCFFDLDDDGYQEPYTVTVHENTQKVVRIVARYEEENIIVRLPNDEMARLEFGDDGAEGDLVKIECNTEITKYGFIHDIEGTYLDIGYYHLLSSLTKALNAQTNMLTDAGTIANLGGGMLAKGFRRSLGNLKMKIGEWIQTNISANDLQSGVFPWPTKEPSPTILSLKEQLEARVKEMTANTDLKGLIAPNAPATTTLGLLQEAMLPTSAIMQNIIDAESEEMRKLYLLTAKFGNEQDYQKVLDDPEANFESDFDLDNMDIMPTANADLSSKMQRIQQAEALMAQVPILQLDPQADIRPIVENWFDAMNADFLFGQVYPSIEDMTKDQEARIQAQLENQQRQEQLQSIQIDLQERAQNNDDRETEAKLRKTAAELDKLEAETIKVLEEAESEAVKNQITTYTAKIEAARGAIGDEIELLNQEREERREQREDRKEAREDRKAEIEINVGQVPDKAS